MGVSPRKWWTIHPEVRTIYETYRPTPLVRACALESALRLGRNISIYYKDESVSPTGSFKLNAALPLVFYARNAGFQRVTCATGAGQWGQAIAYASRQFGMQAKVYMCSDSFRREKEKVAFMKRYGAEVVETQGNSYDSARNLAIQDCLSTKSFYPDICLELFQSVIGLETMMQCREERIQPSVMIACLGGGSNLAGFFAPFVAARIKMQLMCQNSHKATIS
jgi:predicted alternative tryptophan synthase beta-subunit